MSRTFPRTVVVVSSSIQASLGLVPLLTLPPERRGLVGLGLPILWFLMVAGVGLHAQARPTLRNVAIVINGLLVLPVLPQIALSFLDLIPGSPPSRLRWAEVGMMIALVVPGSLNVIALAQIMHDEARDRGKKPDPARDWDMDQPPEICRT